jgi:DNA-binding NtrC family response regulator
MESRPDGAKKILVIDDEEKILDVLECALQSEGYEVRCAGNGKEGMKLLQSEPFDLIVSDIIMPEMDGFELVRGLQKESFTTPVLIMSGGSTRLSPDALLEMARMFSARRTLMKPFKIDQFLTAVREILEPAT